MKIVVGEGSCGIAAGAEKVRQALLKEDLNGAMLTIAGCIGMCYLEPIVDIYEDGKEVKRLVRVTENDAKKIAEYAKTGDENAIAPLLVSDEDKEFLNKQTRIALRRCGIINPDEIEDFIQADGYTAIKKVLNEMTPEDQKSALITRGLGGKKNISDVDCCATRLRCTVVKPELVNEDVLRMTSPSGIVRKGQGIQVIYGPAVSVIKSNLEDYLEKAPDVEYLPKENENSAEKTNKCAETKDEAKKDENKTVAAETVKKELCSPFTGVAAPIEEACDEAFAGKMMGDGYLVRPEEGMAYAPEDATVSFIFPSKHAVGLTSDDGTEYLLHIGVDTVNLDGKGFETFVNDGDRVKKGDKLIGFDIKYIQEHAKSDECMVVFTSLQEGEEIRMSKSGKVEKLEKTAEIVSLN